MLSWGVVLLLTCGSAENLLQNPSFETLDGGKPGSWDAFVMPGPGTAKVDRGAAEDGDYSVMLRNAGSYPDEPYNNWSQSINANLAGKALKVEAHIKTENADGAAVWLQCWRKDPWGVIHVATTSDSTIMTGTRGWTLVAMTVHVPEGTDFVMVRCVLKGQGTAWFDNVAVREAEAESPEPKKPETESAAMEPEPVAGGAPGGEGGAGEPAALDDATRQQLLEEGRDLADTVRSYREANEVLAKQVGELRENVEGLRQQVETLKTAPKQTAPESGAPEGKPRRRVPPLVPHGYVLEELY